MGKARQDDLSRQRRLNEGRCPQHGIDLVPVTVKLDVYACPRQDCQFEIEPKVGTKLWVSLFGRRAG